MSRFGRIRNVKSRRKYSDVFDALKEEIVGGKYCAGSVFPSHAMIARRFGISNLTAVKVVEKLKDAGLVCSQQGRGTFVTRQGASRKIGILVPDIGQSELFSKIVHEIVQCAQNAGYLTLFGDIASPDAEFRAQKAEALARDFVAQGVAGVIFQPVEFTENQEVVNRRILETFDRAGIPVVFCDCDLMDSSVCSGYDVVGVNNFEVGGAMYDHVVACGARRISFLLRPNSSRSHWNRCQGALLRTMAKGQRPCAVLQADPGDLNAVRRHLRRQRPDAIICPNDKTAARLLHVLDKLGYAVPDDVLLVGCDDTSLSRLTTPALTTVHLPCDQIGAEAFRRLLERIAHPDVPTQERFLSFKLISRESTKRTIRKPTGGRT